LVAKVQFYFDTDILFHKEMKNLTLETAFRKENYGLKYPAFRLSSRLS